VTRYVHPISPGDAQLILQSNQNLHRFTFPAINSTSLQPWIQAGLAAEAQKLGFSIKLDWGTKQSNGFFRRTFPKLFEYFNLVVPEFRDIADELDNTGMRRIEYPLQYILLQKVYKKYHVVDEMHPVAGTYKVHLAGERVKNAGYKARACSLVGVPTSLFQFSRCTDPHT